MNGPRLIAIELEGFRGASKQLRLDLDADAVVVRGDNGSGKTTLVDGLLWLFCGELHYLAERLSGLRQGESIVQNRFTSVPARVALELDHDGRRYVFVRSGGDKKPALEMRREGKVVEDADRELACLFGHTNAASLQAAVYTWGLLRQDAVRVALDAAGGALYQRLAGIVGFEQVSGFGVSARRATQQLLTQRTAQRKSVTALRRQRDEAVSRHRSATQELGSPEGVDGQLRKMVIVAVARLGDGFSLEVPAELGLTGTREMIEAAEEVVKALRSLAGQRADLAILVAKGDDDVERAETKLAIVGRRMKELSQRGPATARMAQAALEVLDGDTCPVCGQSVTETELRSHLEEMAQRADEVIESAQQASDALARSASELSRARELSRQRRDCETLGVRGEQSVTTALDGVSGLRLTSSIPADSAGVESLARGLEAFLDDVRAAYQRASQAGGAHLQRLIGEADALSVELESAERELELIERRYEEAKILEKAAHTAAQAIVSDALERLQPSFAEVFDRLNPNPAFTELRAKQDVLRNVNQVIPVVRDPERGVEANPQVVFSEGQLNVVALSYFLGMALNAGDLMLPFLILDDPLQSLDTIAVLGFGDLCRRIRDQRQLIVTTHDRRFSDILVRKLSPRETGVSTIVHEFDGWTRDGPSVRTMIPDVAEVIPLLQRKAS
jgi:DNA repair exonuclease SbcCD ATPase subunit